MIDDIAPDVSVYPAGPDPTTGGRQLEQLAFEIVSTQSLRNAGARPRASPKASHVARPRHCFAVLAARGLPVGAAERGRIVGERDPGQLDRWLAEATICAEASALFTTPSRR